MLLDLIRGRGDSPSCKDGHITLPDIFRLIFDKGANGNLCGLVTVIVHCRLFVARGDFLEGYLVAGAVVVVIGIAVVVVRSLSMDERRGSMDPDTLLAG